MADKQSGYDRYGGTKSDDRKNAKTRGRGVPGGIRLEVGGCAS